MYRGEAGGFQEALVPRGVRGFRRGASSRRDGRRGGGMTRPYRMGRALRATLCALVLCEAVAALAQEVDGQDSMGKEPGARLQARCEPLRDDAGPRDAAQQADAQACLGFIDGFVWGHAWAAWRSGTDMWFCLPQGFSSRQGVSAVIEYLDAHPDRLTEDAHLLVFLALTAAYPCKP